MPIMPKFATTLITGLGAVCLLPVGLWTGVSWWLNTPGAREFLTRQLKERSGWTMHLRGSLDLALFPPGVVIADFNLSSPADSREQLSATARQLMLRLSAPALLAGRLELASSRLDGLNMQWLRDFPQEPRRQTNGEVTGAHNVHQPSPWAPGLLAVGGLELHEAALHWEDRASAQSGALEGVELTTGPLSAVPGPWGVRVEGFQLQAATLTLGDPEASVAIWRDLTWRSPAVDANAPLTLDGRAIWANALLEAPARINIQATAQWPVAGAPWVWPQFQLHIPDLRWAATGFGASLEASGHGVLDPLNGRVQFPALQLRLGSPNHVEAEWPVVMRLDGASAHDLRQLSIPHLQAAGSWPRVQGQVEAVPWQADFHELQIDLRQASWPSANWRIQSAGLHGSGTVRGAHGQAAGSWSIAPANPRDLLTVLGIGMTSMQDPSAFSQLSGAGEWQWSGQRLRLDPLTLRLDQSHLQGWMAVQPARAPAYEWALQLDQLDLDRYAPTSVKPAGITPLPTRPEAVAPQASAERPALALLAAPLEGLRRIHAQGSLAIERLVYRGVHAGDVKIEAQSHDGALSLKHQARSFYQGSWQGQLDYRQDEQQATWQTNQQWSNMQIGSLLHDLGVPDRLTGQGSLQATLEAQAPDPQQLSQALHGTLEVDLRDGAIQGINLLGLMQKTRARLTGQHPVTDAAPNETPYETLKARAELRTGVLYVHDVLAQSPWLKVSGQGDVELANDELDGRARALIQQAPPSPAGDGLQDLVGLSVPLVLSGTAQRPVWTVDVVAFLAENRKGPWKARLEEQIQRKLGIDPRVLKGLLLR